MFVVADGAIVNLFDKDITIEKQSEWAEYDYRVMARGSHAGADEEFFHGKDITLHVGTRDECLGYLDELADVLEAWVPVNIPSTPRPEQPEPSGTGSVPDDLPF